MNIPLLIICLIGFLGNLSIGLVYPIFAGLFFDSASRFVDPQMSMELRGFFYGALIAATPLAQFFSSPILGALSDHRGRKKILQLGSAVAIGGYIVAVLGVIYGSVATLLLYRIILGSSDGTIAVAQAAIADISTEASKARNFSWFHSALGLGFTIGPFVGGLLVDSSILPWFDYTTPFIVTGVLSFVNLILITFLLPNRKPSAEIVAYNVWDGLYNLKRAFHWQGLRIFFLATFLFAFGWSFYQEFIPITLINQLSFTTAQIGEYFAYNGLWYAVSTAFLTAPLLKRFGPGQLVAKCLFLTALYMPLFLLIERPLMLWFYIPFLVYLMALVFPTMAALVSNATDSNKQGQVAGVYQSVFAFAEAFSPLLGGLFVGAFPSLTIWCGAMMMILASIIFRSVRTNSTGHKVLPD